MSVSLPNLGMNGVVSAVKELSGTTKPGYRAVDQTTEFVAGMVAKLVANSTTGNPEVKRADADDTNLIGLFNSNKTTSFYRAVVCEPVTFGTSPNTATLGYLKHANLKGAAGTYVVVSSTGVEAADFDYTTDFTISYVNGTITRVAGQAIGATATVYVSYFYEDPALVGIDETLGSNLVATIEGVGEVALLVYDTTYAFTLMGNVYCNADGYVTSNSGGGSVVGKVTKVPTNEDPSLHIKISL